MKADYLEKLSCTHDVGMMARSDLQLRAQLRLRLKKIKERVTLKQTDLRCCADCRRRLAHQAVGLEDSAAEKAIIFKQTAYQVFKPYSRSPVGYLEQFAPRPDSQEVVAEGNRILR